MKQSEAVSESVYRAVGRRARVDKRAFTCEMDFSHFSVPARLPRGPGNEDSRYSRVRAKLREVTPTAKGGVGWDDFTRSSREKKLLREQHFFSRR